MKDLHLVKEERSKLEAENVCLRQEVSKIWVATARICKGERAAEKLEKELGLS